MKVLKFGGSSVGTPESVLNVKRIVEATDGPVIVVVSALRGITDKLINTAKMAGKGDDAYKSSLVEIRERHYSMIDTLLSDAERNIPLKNDIDNLLSGLESLCLGTYLLKSLSGTILDEIVSYGERMSSHIVAKVVDDAARFDSLDFIRTVSNGRKNVLDAEATTSLVVEAFNGFESRCRVAVVPGFISRDAASGRITNLGRGGSDYTASIIAADLNAEILEIWTDVDGFMTADPRVVKNAYVIDELSYAEAMELCNFGAKVIYAPTLYPVCAKDIPILIKNTFNPSAPGSIINRDFHHRKTITGITSIDNCCLITVSAISMAGLIGVNGRIFNALADAHISVFLVSQSSSETNITIGVNNEDADLACKVLSETFGEEIKVGAMDPVKLEKGFATIAIVGENMKFIPGIAGKLFSFLGRNGMSINAISQGATERNISFVLESRHLTKSLNLIHDNFFLSENKELNLFICGVGTVGGELIAQIARQKEKLKEERNLELNVVGIARSSKAIFDCNGLNLETWKQALEDGEKTDPQSLKEKIISLNLYNSVFVDCTADAGVAGIYGELLDNGISVVAANKIAASSSYGTYSSLKQTARKRNVKYLFETNAGAGLPVINTINALCNSGDCIEKLQAVLSGTLNFIFNTISGEIPFSKAVRMAADAGFAEPDPRVDLSGKDVIRKLVILSRESGCKVEQEDVDARLFIPQEFFDCTLDEFWKRLPELDGTFEDKRRVLAAAGLKQRFVATMEAGRLSVGLEEVPEGHPFHNLEGSNNVVLITTRRYHEHPLHIQGYGAGASVTAAGVFADIISIANI